MYELLGRVEIFLTLRRNRGFLRGISFLCTYSCPLMSIINAKNSSDAEETSIYELFGDLMVRHSVPQSFGNVVATSAGLLADDHLDDVFVILHVQLFDIPANCVGNSLGP